MSNILKQGNNILKSGNSIFQVGGLGADPVFDLNAETIAGHVDGQAIEKIVDAQGGGYFLYQDVSANRPTFVASAINSKPGVKFTGASTHFLKCNIAFPCLTIFLVYKWDSTADWQFIFGGKSAGNETYHGGSAGKVFHDGTATYFGHETHKGRLFVGGTRITPKNTYTRHTIYQAITIDGADSQFNLSHLGVRDNGTQYPMSGVIVRMIIYNYRMSELRRKQIEAELKTLYAL